MRTTATNPRTVAEPVEDAFAYEVIDAEELERRWCMAPGWALDQTRDRQADPIPHLKVGKYIRFEWGSPALGAWWKRRRRG